MNPRSVKTAKGATWSPEVPLTVRVAKPDQCAGFYVPNERPKKLWIHPLAPEAKALLRSPPLPAGRAAGGGRRPWAHKPCRTCGHNSTPTPPAAWPSLPHLELKIKDPTTRLFHTSILLELGGRRFTAACLDP